MAFRIMNNLGSELGQDDAFNDEIFDDSYFIANFENNSSKESPGQFSNQLNESSSKNFLDVSALCCDEEISGFDKLTGKTWIYPTNYPVRDYQFNIIKAAILKNTLVSLPTGLGKTFIAAVIMYNFYRWYPLGKIVFTAPTRPLVAQQIDACYNIIAIPPNDTIEMTGHMKVQTRKAHWHTKRVFFATPQVIYNDIQSGICPGDKIRCLVIDEAHRARGNYAYCQIVSTLTEMGHKTYRILALSATPGSKVEDVINVVKNLHIAHLELRTENCIDVARYSHSRKINSVVIPLGPVLTQLRRQYVEILDEYARRLKQLNILTSNIGNMSKGRIVMLYKEYQTRDRGARHPQHNIIMRDFTSLIALYHGLELLVRHGSRVFLNFFDEHPEKTWIQSDDKLTALLERLRDDLGANPLSLDTSILPDGTMPEIPKNLTFGHPKFEKLKEIMLQHFTKAKQKGEDTRAIVFCEYRESVSLVHCLLLQCRPLIVAQMFVGQGASGKDGKAVVSQKQQLRVMRQFREGACNTLVATCVAEEGLDVGSVDLIICFDISTRSPIRLVQRCGRTGRERGGQVYILVTEGREHQTLVDCMRQRDGLNKKIQHSKEVENNLFKSNSRMIPHDYIPECQKMFITVAKKSDTKDKPTVSGDKGQKDLRNMFLGRASSGSSNSSNKGAENPDQITEEEFKELYPNGYFVTKHLADREVYWTMSKAKILEASASNANRIKLSAWLEWQRNLQKTVNIGHSSDSEILTTLLKYSDAKRFELPASTQNPTFSTQDFVAQDVRTSPVKQKLLKKQKLPQIKSPLKKDGDIRALFSTATKSTKNYTKLINDLGILNDGSVSTALINLFVDLSLQNSDTLKTCYICQNVCQCNLIANLRKHKQKLKMPLTFLDELKLPDIDLIDEITTDSIFKYVNNADDHQEMLDVSTSKDNKSNLEEQNKINTMNNFDLEFDFTSPNDALSTDAEKKYENTDKNFDIGEIDDLFADSSPEEQTVKCVTPLKNNISDSSDPKDTLGFFGLESIDDIFADSCEVVEASETSRTFENNNNSVNNVKVIEDDIFRPPSPSILSGRAITKVDFPTSPILCSQTRKFQLSIKKNRIHSSTPQSSVKRQLLADNTIFTKSHETKLIKADAIKDTSLIDTTNKSMLTITQLVEMINKTDREASSHTKLNIFNKITGQGKDNESVENLKRSQSPILLTQAERKNISLGVSNKSSDIISLIILESDSDSDNTQSYNIDENKYDAVFIDSKTETFQSPQSSKRKLSSDDTLTASPYFSKKQKLHTIDKKTITLQEKVLEVLNSNKPNINKTETREYNVNYLIDSEICLSQKENKSPTTCSDLSSLPTFKNQEFQSNNKNGKVTKNFESTSLQMLQMFKRDNQEVHPKKKFNNVLKNKLLTLQKNITFDDSDDDFVVTDLYTQKSRTQTANEDKRRTVATNHKVRKKKKKRNQFIDSEAELSDGDGPDSGDELSDDSIGSVADFIDDNVSHHEDIYEHYLRSIKSPVKGTFKIPQLPNMFKKIDVFSQYVEDDTYEMDSFCVDSHIGLTQVNDLSELELAELALEKRKAKKKPKVQTEEINDSSPVIGRKYKNVRRLIQSDSDDSS